MNRAEALQKLADEHWQPEPGLPYEIARVEPRDAWGVARCYHDVYGKEYPVDAYYIPERLLEQIDLGNLHMAVARTSQGDIVGCSSFYRSSCPHPGVFEAGGVLLAHAYRGGTIPRELADCVMGTLMADVHPEAMFTESVCHHLVTQRMSVRHQFIDCALEIGGMPAEAYPREEFATDRVSLVLAFRSYEAQQHCVYLPKPYGEQIVTLLHGLEYARTTRECGAAEPAAAETGLHTEYFGFAQVARVHVGRVGQDFEAVFQAFESEMLDCGARVLQFHLNLGEPAVERAVEWLRRDGYFFGGILPHWFGADGLLMQKVLDMPDFRSVKLYSKRARGILEMVRADVAGWVGGDPVMGTH